jgi:type IV pilus assembly protein PilC
MKTYKYKVLNRQGKQEFGEVDANTPDDVVTILQNEGYSIISIEDISGFNLDRLMKINIGGIPLAEKVIFMKQFSTMISAGLPISAALETMATQISNISFKADIKNVLKEIKAGTNLYTAFKQNNSNKLFNEVQLSLLKAGETSGNLSEMILKIAADLENSKNFISKVRGALIYPAIIFVVMIIVIAVLIIFMVPAVSGLFESSQSDLPALTKGLISVANFIDPSKSFGGVFLLIGFVVLGIFVSSYYKTPTGRIVLDQVRMRIPVFGPLQRKVDIAQFCRILSMLLASGINISESLKITSNAMGLIQYRNAVLNVIPAVERGGTVSQGLESQKIFPEVLTKIISTGETTGKLDKVLADIAKYYETEVDDMTSNLTKLLEPIILLVVGGMVVVVVLAIYIPIFDLAKIVVK